MAVNTPREIVDSYIGLLIMQYLNKPGASGTINAFVSPLIQPQTSIQTITFSDAPTSGTFVLSYNGVNTAAINWNDSTATIQSKLQAIPALSAVTVIGTIASKILSVTFTGVFAPALYLTVYSNTLFSSSSITIAITEIDETLPLAVQNAFNLIAGTAIAQGVQLDTLGKYTGVVRSGLGFTQSITLNDSDFYKLIQMSIVLNYAGSSLSDIQNFLHQFFAGQIYVFDYQNMNMSYIISQEVGSQDLIQMFVTQGLLPVPMGVGVTIFYPPSANLFSFRTYELPSNGEPFNTYEDYHLDWPWLDYNMIVTP